MDHHYKNALITRWGLFSVTLFFFLIGFLFLFYFPQQKPFLYFLFIPPALTTIIIAKKNNYRFSHNKKNSPLNNIVTIKHSNKDRLILKLQALMHEKKAFSLCCININGYLAVEHYLSKKEKKHSLSTIANIIEKELNNNKSGVIVKLENTVSRHLYLKEGLFYFLLLSDDETKIDKTLSHLLDNIKSVIHLEHFNLFIQGKIGVSRYPKDATNADSLINKSQLAFIASHHHERNNNTDAIFKYDPISDFNHKLNITLINDLQKAIDNNELSLYHQAQFSLKNNTLYGYETLVRWEHPKFGSISPHIFIKLAEQIGFINTLTDWVINKAFEQQSLLLKLGFQHRFSINVSGFDICINRFIGNILERAKKYKVPTSLLSIELTESVIVRDINQLKNTMETLLDHKINISIDDFGTGHSSLFYLSQLPFTELKIDRSFIQDVAHNHRQQKIVKSTIAMAKSLNLTLVAEGVENKETADKLKQYGVNIAQGYYYSRPLCFKKYIQYLQNNALKTHELKAVNS